MRPREQCRSLHTPVTTRCIHAPLSACCVHGSSRRCAASIMARPHSSLMGHIRGNEQPSPTRQGSVDEKTREGLNLCVHVFVWGGSMPMRVCDVLQYASSSQNLRGHHGPRRTQKHVNIRYYKNIRIRIK